MFRKWMAILLMLCLTCTMAAAAGENPCVGTWTVLCGVSGYGIEDFSNYGKAAQVIVEDDRAILVDGDDQQLFDCAYVDGQCVLSLSGSAVYTLSLGEDGMLRMYNASYEGVYVLLSPADEVVPEYIGSFFGDWTVMDIPGQESLAAANYRLRFGRAVCRDYGTGDIYLCEYTEDGCLLYLYSEAFAICRVTEDGTLLLTSLDGTASIRMTRVEE